MATIQKHMPSFRHNDLSWYNIRSTFPMHMAIDIKRPSGTTGTTNSKVDTTISVNGTVYVPDPYSNARGEGSYTDYTFGNQTFHVINYGYQTRIADWDFAGNAHISRMWNAKISHRSHRACARPLPTIWEGRIRILGVHLNF